MRADQRTEPLPIDPSIAPKAWWRGDARVEPYMLPVRAALDRHLPCGETWTDIYNRAYEAVYRAINDTEGGNSRL